MGAYELVEVEGTVVRKTGLAYLVDDGNVREWVPRELMEGLREIGDDMIIFDIPQWLAYEKGFI